MNGSIYSTQVMAESLVLAYVVPLPTLFRLPTEVYTYTTPEKMYFIYSRIYAKQDAPVAEAERFFMWLWGNSYNRNQLHYVHLPISVMDLPLLHPPDDRAFELNEQAEDYDSEMSAEQANKKYTPEQQFMLKQMLDEELRDIELVNTYNLSAKYGLTIQEIIENPLFDVHREAQKN